MREHIEIISDYDTLSEMTVFVKDERGRASAMQGQHDDLVMACAITYYIRDQQKFVPEPEQVKNTPVNKFWTMQQEEGGIIEW